MKCNLVIRKAAVTLFLSMLCLFAYAQKTITGTILDNMDEPMIGVNVLVKGTTNGAITDFDGKFTLSNVKADDIIVCSYIGYLTEEVKVGDRTNLKIVMKDDSKSLDEVVVVGYGQMKKSDLTGSVASVQTDALVGKGTPSVVAALQGSVPGVNITQTSGRAGGGFNVEIRGKSSTNPDTAPIYVVDGIICSDIQFLNPQDIEQVDILKDASSTAIYGSRATAGVVIVTTKSGKSIGSKGAATPSVTYDGFYGISSVARMPDFMNGQEFYNYRFSKFLTYAGTATAQSGQPAYTMGTYEQMALYNNDTEEYRLKSIMASGETTDWPSLVTQDGQQQNHYISVNGSGENVSYYLGVGYNSEKGIYKGDEQRTINVKASMDANINKYISGGFSFNMAHINNDYANDNAVQIAYRMNPFMQPYDANGELNSKPGNYESMGSSSSYQFSDQVSPLLYMMNQTKNQETWRLLGNIYLDIKPLKGLNIKTVFSPNYTHYRLGQFDDTLVDNDTNIAQKTTNRAFSWTWDNTINYNLNIAQKHTINLMGLFSVTSGNTEYDYLKYTGVMDGTLWWNLKTGEYDATASKNSYTESSMLSYALRANYSYLGRYMLTGTVRWDGSSRFADGHRWGSFPSIAAAWRISEEEWMKQEWLSNLKLRLSYGVTGNNSGIGNYATQQTVVGPIYYPFGGDYSNGFYPSSIVNKALTWETSKEINVGLDFGFLNNRISGTLDFYQKDSKDLLFDVTLPFEAGATSTGGAIQMTTNVGKIRNRGLEASLTTVNVQTKDWNWETTFTFAANKNKVRDINGMGEDLPNDGLFIGQPFNNVYGFEWTGIVDDRDMIVPDAEIARIKGFTPGQTVKSYDYYYTCYGWTEGQPIINDANGDGVFNEDDKKVYRKDPAWIGSFNTRVTYKNWDLSASLYAKQNYTVSSNFYGEYLGWNDRGRMKLNVDYYIPAGTLIDCDGVNPDGSYINPVYQETTNYGKYPFPNNGASNGGIGNPNWLASTNKYVDASYVKIQNITLGYTFPKMWMDKIGVQRLRLYCTVTNPFVWTKYKGFDPEWADASLRNDGPSTITWQFGANLKF